MVILSPLQINHHYKLICWSNNKNLLIFDFELIKSERDGSLQMRCFHIKHPWNRIAKFTILCYCIIATFESFIVYLCLVVIGFLSINKGTKLQYTLNLK